MAMSSTALPPIMNATLTSYWTELNTTSAMSVNRTGPSLAACGVLTQDTGKIVFAAFLILVMIISVLGNFLVCIAIILSPNLRNNPTNYFVVSLAISDIGFALFQAPIRISQKLNDNRLCFGAEVCWMYVLSDLVVTPATIITLFVIATDRFYCIKRPYVYHAEMTKKKAKVIVAVVWFCACIVASVFIVKWNDHSESPIILPLCQTDNKYFYMMLNFLIIGIPLVIMGIMYFMILRVAISQIRAIRETEVFIQDHDENENNERKESGVTHRRTHRELRATGTLALVYGAFVVCWLPLCILNIIIGLKKDIIIDTYRANPELFSTIYDVLPMLSSAINPIIYNFSNRQFRMAFKVVMYRLVGKSDLLRKATIMRELGVYYAGQNGTRNGANARKAVHRERADEATHESNRDMIDMHLLNSAGKNDEIEHKDDLNNIEQL